MPRTEVVFFQEPDGRAPVRAWLAELHRRDVRGHAKCVARIERLATAGHELRRPEADALGGGLHELRARRGHVNYRILYAFIGGGAAVLLHACTKEGAISLADIHRAGDRLRRLQADPTRHIHED